MPVPHARELRHIASGLPQQIVKFSLVLSLALHQPHPRLEGIAADEHGRAAAIEESLQGRGPIQRQEFNHRNDQYAAAVQARGQLFADIPQTDPTRLREFRLEHLYAELSGAVGDDRRENVDRRHWKLARRLLPRAATRQGASREQQTHNARITGNGCELQREHLS